MMKKTTLYITLILFFHFGFVQMRPREPDLEHDLNDDSEQNENDLTDREILEILQDVIADLEQERVDEIEVDEDDISEEEELEMEELQLEVLQDIIEDLEQVDDDISEEEVNRLNRAMFNAKTVNNHF